VLIDDEQTTFETNPLGNRQRLKPRDSFLARVAVMIESLDETFDRALVDGDHSISDVVLPASSATMHAAITIAPMPSLVPVPVMLLPKEIHYAEVYYPPTDSHQALPIASRRVRYLAVPALAALVLIALGGAMIPPDVEAVSPIADVALTAEATSEVRVFERANEPPAPAEEIVVAEMKSFANRVVRRPGKVTVNASTALGNLRPKRAW